MAVDTNYPQAVLIWLDMHRPPLLPQCSMQLWSAIHDELSPIVGASGFIALYSRCLDICGASFSWLEKAPAPSSAMLCFSTLGAQLAARAAPEALAASCALFTIFYKLLRVLVGPALTASVLDAAWRDRLSQRPVQFPPLKAVSPQIQ